MIKARLERVSRTRRFRSPDAGYVCADGFKRFALPNWKGRLPKVFFLEVEQADDGVLQLTRCGPPEVLFDQVDLPLVREVGTKRFVFVDHTLAAWLLLELGSRRRFNAWMRLPDEERRPLATTGRTGGLCDE